MQETEGVEIKLLLASICEEIYLKSMSIIRWTPGQSHLADALSKDSQEIAVLLNIFLTTDQHSRPESLYVAVSDILGPATDVYGLPGPTKANYGNSEDTHDHSLYDTSA